MKCAHLTMSDGQALIVCGAIKVATCYLCGKEATKLCDWHGGQKRTCDRGLCDEHATSPAPNKDLCPPHAKMWAERNARAASAAAVERPQ